LGREELMAVFGNRFNQPQVQIPPGEDQLFMQELGGMSFRQPEGLTKWQLEPSDIIEEIRQLLLGAEWTKKGWVINKESRLMNEKGINRFITILRAHLSKIISLSDLNDLEINRVARDCRIAVIREIFYHEKEFGIDKAMRDTLVEMMDHKVYCFLKQAKDGGMRKFLQTTERKIETFRETDSNYANNNDGMGGNGRGGGWLSGLRQKLL
jgi:hypothetical protein